VTMQCSRIQDEELSAQKMELLYGEADAETRARVEAHLAECAACREEMAALARLRRDLRAWTIDEGRPSLAVPSRPWTGWLGLAAACLLGLGVGLALVGYASLRHDLATQQARAVERERRYREEIATLRASLDTRSAIPDQRRLMARVDETLDKGIRESERRQRQQLQASFARWTDEMEARRRLDLARVAAGLSYLDGQQGEQLARTNELMGYVLEAAGQER
jgi:anti-sigma factor RsiW